jgi:hypothetical protein
MNREFLLYVHDIFPRAGYPNSTEHILATKYSFFSDILPLEPPNSDHLNSEVVMHFADANQVGQPGDAELIRFDQIMAWHPTSSIQLRPEAEGKLIDPDVLLWQMLMFVDSTQGFYCRFAIYRACDPGSACWIPLPQPSLLDRRKSVTPIVLDLSPSDIGGSCGLRQAGWNIGGAVAAQGENYELWQVSLILSAVLDAILKVLPEAESESRNARLGAGPFA